MTKKAAISQKRQTKRQSKTKDSKPVKVKSQKKPKVSIEDYTWAFISIVTS
jgi:hypothetical protein